MKEEKILKLVSTTRDDAYSKDVILASGVKTKLTPKQDFIIYCLQNGCCLICGNQYSQVWCGGNQGQFEFSGALFWRMVNKGFIVQSTWQDKSFNYILTALGEKLITKKYNIEVLNK